MPNYRLVIQYDGGRYRGWQKLGNTENTIQGKLERVLAKLVGEDTEIIGCSRTGGMAKPGGAVFGEDRVLVMNLAS